MTRLDNLPERPPVIVQPPNDDSIAKAIEGAEGAAPTGSLLTQIDPR